MKKLILIFLILANYSLIGQTNVTDTEIVKSLIGKKDYNIRPTLDSLKVFYKIHYPDKIKQSQTIVSIANGEGTVKVFSFYIVEGQIIKIVINYRHDNKNQLIDLSKIINPTSYHVGKYSTDVVFKE